MIRGDLLAAEIEAMMPGSNCGQRGFAGCPRLAAAIASGSAPASACPPGGKAMALTLARKLGIGIDLAAVVDQGPRIATVAEDICIGCCRCTKVCPTDAILGAAKQIHNVIREACTGCGKCIERCPTEAMAMRPLPVTLQHWIWPKPPEGAAPAPARGQAMGFIERIFRSAAPAWGVHPDDRKRPAADVPLRSLPLPERLFMPLQQHVGGPARPIVLVGQKMWKGQMLAEAQGNISAPVHAPTSGRIVAIGEITAPHPSGFGQLAITLASDGADEWGERHPVADPFALAPDEIARITAAAGVVGLGVATFPAAVKFNPGRGPRRRHRFRTVRLHRLRLLRVCLPVAHSAGPVLSHAKGELSARERARLRHEAARRLVLQRSARLEREAREKAANAARRKAERDAAKARAAAALDAAATPTEAIP